MLFSDKYPCFSLKNTKTEPISALPVSIEKISDAKGGTFQYFGAWEHNDAKMVGRFPFKAAAGTDQDARFVQEITRKFFIARDMKARRVKLWEKIKGGFVFHEGNARNVLKSRNGCLAPLENTAALCHHGGGGFTVLKSGGDHELR